MKGTKLIEVEELNESLLQEVVKRIVAAVNPVRIILFGSQAYGEPHKGSDLDILVIMDNDLSSRYETAVEVYRALRGIHISKDVIVATPYQLEEWRNVPQALITKIATDGKVIYEREDRLPLGKDQK
ncbi:MAG: nucleotidyltransferase domain-containing protein [Dehalococcoidia bacterium]